ncbi:ATP-grasp domain-containing protein [Burkholderia sp. LMG 32019]|uniref:ATP-grasp domain-containing protein n=1 Tax=Burkholderia sp. LMG 32019 TaxID=3158173 RepID=UPI003C2C6683
MNAKVDMPTNIQKCVLVTAAGTATAVNVIKSLSQTPGVRVVTTDSNERHMIAAPARWNTTHYQVPLASDTDAFVSALVAICEKEGVDAIYPIHDAEILAVTAHRARFPARVRLPALSADSVRNSNDKLLNFEICREAGLPVPDTIPGSKLQSSDIEHYHALIRKPRSGVGSVGVRRVTNFDGLDRQADLTDSIVYQQPCTGDEYTIDVLRVGSDLISVARERLETKAGVCTKARVFVHPNTDALARRIADVFELQGLFCFQVIGDIESGDLKIIDINPRCGGGTALSVAAGFPLLQWHFAALLDLQEASEFKSACLRRLAQGGEAIVCRHYEEIVTFSS